SDSSPESSSIFRARFWLCTTSLSTELGCYSAILLCTCEFVLPISCATYAFIRVIYEVSPVITSSKIRNEPHHSLFSCVASDVLDCADFLPISSIYLSRVSDFSDQSVLRDVTLDLLCSSQRCVYEVCRRWLVYYTRVLSSRYVITQGELWSNRTKIIMLVLMEACHMHMESP
ncbi:unnamed protein product, partial [Cochlearia groenlandica]